MTEEKKTLAKKAAEALSKAKPMANFTGKVVAGTLIVLGTKALYEMACEKLNKE